MDSHGEKRHSEYNLVYTANLQHFGESSTERYKSSNSYDNSFEKDQPLGASSMQHQSKASGNSPNSTLQ